MNNTKTWRVMKRKRSTEKSHFGFIADVEDDASLSREEKINVILETLTKMKIEIDQHKNYPTWVTKEETKKLLSVLNIDPSDKFKFFDDTDQEQTQFKQLLYKLLDLNKKYAYSKMSELIVEHVDLFSKYKFPNNGAVMDLIVAMQQLVAKKGDCNGNGEIMLTGLYNAIFHHIYQMNEYKVRGDVLKEISFEEGQPIFQVKCDSYTYAGANVISIREDKSTVASDWEKISTDGYKSIIVGRALLRENLRKFKMKADDVLRYSKFLAITTNIDQINCFLLECSFDEEWNPSYHLSNLQYETLLLGPTDTGLISLVEFVCRYARDYMTHTFQKSREAITIGGTSMKHTHSQISHVSTILRSTQHQSPILLNKRAVVHFVQDNVWFVKSSLTLKKVDYHERYIYTVLLSKPIYCPFLPLVLKYSTEYVELEKLEDIDYKSNWDHEQLLSLLLDMSCALKYLHSINIIHRDVKPNNILLRTGDGDHFAYVLIDFGLSCHFERKENGLVNKLTNLMINENCGTSIFRAPEVANKENYSEKVDIFSLGMTAMYLLDYEKMENEFKNNRNTNWTDILNILPTEQSLKDILENMISPDPTKRPTAEQLEKMLLMI